MPPKSLTNEGPSEAATNHQYFPRFAHEVCPICLIKLKGKYIIGKTLNAMVENIIFPIKVVI